MEGRRAARIRGDVRGAKLDDSASLLRQPVPLVPFGTSATTPRFFRKGRKGIGATRSSKSTFIRQQSRRRGKRIRDSVPRIAEL